MAVYLNTAKSSPLESVEFTPVSNGNFSFFTARGAEQKDLVRKWLGEHMGQEIMAETTVGGKPVFITRGDKTKQELIEALKLEGDSLKLIHQKKKIDAWRVVSMLAVPGQLLQLTSSFMRKNGQLDPEMFAFAAANLTGHAIAWAYGAQKSEDENRLVAIKSDINESLQPHLSSGQVLLDVDDKRLPLRHETKAAPSVGEKMNGFMKKNSVYVSEFACRYLGAFALAFPTRKLKAAGAELKQGNFKQAYLKGRGSFRDHPEKATLSHYAGMGSLLGKTIALTSKPEDPYNPKPKSWLDNIREKYTFRTGGAIEALAFATYAGDSFTNKDRRIVLKKGGKDYVDFVGGAGSVLFSIRYVMRNWAKFGVKELNTEELYAHVTDSLAKTSEDKLPQLMADTASELAEHLKDKHASIGQIYTKLMTDMYRYHQLSVNAAKPESEIKTAQVAATAKVAQDDGVIASAKKKIGDGLDDAPVMAASKIKPIEKIAAAKDAAAGHLDRLERQGLVAEAQR